MKTLKVYLFVVSMLISLSCIAPPVTEANFDFIPVCLVVESTPVIRIDPIFMAHRNYESTDNPLAVNKAEQAYGILQIRQIMIDDVNRICIIRGIKETYTLRDALNVDKSRRIWYIVQNYYNPSYDAHIASLVWNGRGKTGTGNIDYWKQIQKRINAYS